MDNETARLLVRTLIAATRTRGLSWKQNASKDGYLCNYLSWTIELRMLSGPRGTLRQLTPGARLLMGTYAMEVRDERGSPIENLREEKPGVAIDVLKRPEPTYGLEELFDAISNAGNTEIHSLIKALEPLTHVKPQSKES